MKLRIIGAINRRISTARTSGLPWVVDGLAVGNIDQRTAGMSAGPTIFFPALGTNRCPKCLPSG